MTNKSISQLTAGAAVASTDIFPDVQTVGVGPVKVTAAQIGEYVLTGSGLTGILPVARGGTGLSTMTAANNALYSTSSSALTAGTLPVAAGGTGLTSLTAGYIPFGNGTSAFGNSSNLFWDSANGRLGVGTSSPGYKLDVSGSTGNTIGNFIAGTTRFQVYLDDAVGEARIGANGASGVGAKALTFFVWNGSSYGEKMRIDSSGNVGIGAVPSNPLQLYRSTTAQTAMLQIEQAGSGSSTLGFLRTASYAWLMGQYSADASFRIAASGADLNTNARFVIDTSGNVGIGTSSPASSLNVIGTGTFGQSYGGVGSLTVFQNTATNYILQWSRTDNTGVGGIAVADTAGAISIYTAGSERMRIDSSGNVGIGTSSPGYKFEVSGSSVAGGSLETSVTNTQSSTNIILVSTGTTYSFSGVGGSTGFVTSNKAMAIGPYGAYALQFITNGAERARIDSSGNVVVNTAAIATNATDGFLYVPTCAGTPTGTPTTYTGRAPIVVNTTNNKLYFYSGGAWRDAGP